MAIRPIRLFGDPVLTSRAREVPESAFGTEKLRTQVADMLDTMDDAGGVGLAANQIGLLNRVIVFDTTGGDAASGGLRGELINPVWEAVGEQTQVGGEGCLSIPGVTEDVERAWEIRASGRDAEGRPVTISATELLARCIQHEVDHLDGILFLKRLDREARRRAMAYIRTAPWFTN
ncbi:peptide deformylase [Corynebacterium uterequi]|uniref:Peptide deformylase n=1 Tax=Corynebacterium uterequi TaxID=1072256 RepID=A0A0G3HJ97_9CORY|nr:peptide deformylase [Corynebacterium uterequi]AKK11177.1 peptide deformylase [Corynebacterium uterequi]